MTERTTCLVVGGGPAGMVLGLLLARAGVEVTVLEKHGDFLRDFRGDTVHPSTMQLLDELGLGDRFARLLAYRGDMDAEWTSYASDTREIATAFVAGVNAYVALVRDRPPVEFTLLGYSPEPWTAQVPLQRMAALAMTGNAESEVFLAQLVSRLGPERVAKLWPTIPHRELDPAPGLALRGVNMTSLGAYSSAVGGLASHARSPRRHEAHC